MTAGPQSPSGSQPGGKPGSQPGGKPGGKPPNNSNDRAQLIGTGLANLIIFPVRAIAFLLNTILGRIVAGAIVWLANKIIGATGGSTVSSRMTTDPTMVALCLLLILSFGWGCYSWACSVVKIDAIKDALLMAGGLGVVVQYTLGTVVNTFTQVCQSSFLRDVDFLGLRHETEEAGRNLKIANKYDNSVSLAQLKARQHDRAGVPAYFFSGLVSIGVWVAESWSNTRSVDVGTWPQLNLGNIALTVFLVFATELVVSLIEKRCKKLRVAVV